jgi:hypothetical protein
MRWMAGEMRLGSAIGLDRPEAGAEEDVAQTVAGHAGQDQV